MNVVVGESLEYRYVIDVFTPETLPMSRLAEYVQHWATLLGPLTFIFSALSEERLQGRLASHQIRPANHCHRRG